MPKYKITIDFESKTLEVHAKNEEDAKNKGYEQFNKMLDNNEIDKTPNHWVAEIEEDEGEDLLLSVESFKTILNNMLGGDTLYVYCSLSDVMCNSAKITVLDNGIILFYENTIIQTRAYKSIDELINSKIEFMTHLRMNNLFSYAYENHKLKQWIK